MKFRTTVPAVKTMMLCIATAALFAGMSACGNSNNENSSADTDTMSAAPADATSTMQPADTGMNNMNNNTGDSMNSGANSNMHTDSMRR
jgi:hypothetical protein